MNRRSISRLMLAPMLLGGAALVSLPDAASASCQLGNGIKHVFHLTFDNVHLRRDNPNVPSDLELMPNLLNFMTQNGTVSANHHTPLISHTATDILTAQTGVYGDRMGVPIANSYGVFSANNQSVSFPSSFLYWTATSTDGLPQMLNEHGKTAPAPWVAFTRAGCDVGGFSVANIEGERVPDDITTFFGAGSPQETEVKLKLITLTPTGATHTSTTIDNVSSTQGVVDGMVITGSGIPSNTTITSHTATTLTLSKATTSSLASTTLTIQNTADIRQQPTTDYLGIAVHCAKNSPLCTGANAQFAADDNLPDEPGGDYLGSNGYKILFGHINVKPVIKPGSDQILDLDGNVVTDGFNRPGFPNAFSPTATQSLGYAAQMFEAGVPVVYVYIADAHDNRSGSGTFGPGEQQYVQQLQQYDIAFGKFFARLAADGITKDNTLFIITADENDHFVGGTPTPPNCDGVVIFCTYGTNQKGEITANLNRLLFAQRGNATPFSVHTDDAPNMYIVGNPSPTDPVVRTMEKDLDALTAVSPITGQTEKLSALLADQAEMNLLHMVTASPKRTPTLTMFGNSNYFFQTSGSATAGCPTPSTCIFVNPSFAWNHGDFQQDITRNWFGMVGPGVLVQGRNDSTFTDHTDLRPTMMTLVGLTDDYVHDGRVIIDKLDQNRLPANLRASYAAYRALADIYKQLNAPLGSVGMNSLVYANNSIIKDDASYANYLATLGNFTAARNNLNSAIIGVLNGVAFGGQMATTAQVAPLIAQARTLISQMQTLANTP